MGPSSNWESKINTINIKPLSITSKLCTNEVIYCWCTLGRCDFHLKGIPSLCLEMMVHLKCLGRLITMLTGWIFRGSMEFLAPSMWRALSPTMKMISLQIWRKILLNKGRMMYPWRIMMMVNPKSCLNPRKSKRSSKSREITRRPIELLPGAI